VQGFNAQVFCGEGQIALAASVTNETNDYQQLVPMLDELAENLAAAGVDSKVGVVLADAGYFSESNVGAVNEREIDALIATTKRHKQPEAGSGFDPVAEAAAVAAFEAEQARIADERDAERRRRAEIFEEVAAEGGDVRDRLEALGVSQAVAYIGYAQWRNGGVSAISVARQAARVPRPVLRSNASAVRDAMTDKLAEPANRERYKLRGHLVETFFGQTKHNRGHRRFSRRGLAAVNAEWRFVAAVHNIGRIAAAAG
jgi:Transposase DDE domain